jgi:hypothetical protein
MFVDMALLLYCGFIRLRYQSPVGEDPYFLERLAYHEQYGASLLRPWWV